MEKNILQTHLKFFINLIQLLTNFEKKKKLNKFTLNINSSPYDYS